MKPPSSFTPRPPWQPPSLAELQALLPGYEFLALLGRGGMGAVFKATQRSLNRSVAIKVLPAALLEHEDANFAARFRQESLTMAKLTHPGIVGVFESGEAGGLLYIVMEFVDGTDVARMIAGEGKLAPELATRLLTQVCDALHYAHERGIVHRDIKPANLLLTRDGTVKIADFGLAKHHDDALLGLTKTNVAIGTPDFLAPEAWTPNTPLDGRADVYALGVTLYQMLTGEVPRGLWKMPSVKAGVDARFDAIIDRAMQPDRDARYQSSAELRRDLEEIQAGPSVASPRLRRVAIALVAVAVLFAGGITALLVWPDSPDWLVTSVKDDGRGSLRQAIAIAEPGTTITFAPGLSGRTILLTNGHLLVDKSLTIDGSTLKRAVQINGNRASRILFVTTNATVVLRSLIITNGHARDLDDANIGGGGVYNAGRLEVSHCTLVGNSSTGGGGAIGSRSPLVVSRCTLTGNRAFGGGGIGIYHFSGGALTVNHCTLTGNKATGGGPDGVGGDIFCYVAPVTNFNSIASDVHINQGSLRLAGVNIIEKYGAYQVRSPKNPAPITNAPLLAALGDYGGPTPTMPPLPGSPALDGGDNSATNIFTTDQRGFAPLIGPRVDIGAVEAVWPPTHTVVTTAADSGPGSLRYAIEHYPAGSTIGFTSALSGATVLLTRGELMLNKSLTIDAAALPLGLSIDGNAASHVFVVTNRSVVVLNSLTITNGKTGSGTGGAGLHNHREGTLTLNRCTFVGNTAGYGGAVINKGTLTVNNSTLSGNSATVKGGGGILNIGTLLVNHSTISGNWSEADAGGIDNRGRMTISNSIVAGNKVRPDENIYTFGPLPGAGNLTDGDPRLAPLGHYGGPTPTMSPLPGSPAIDAAIGSVFTNDQRGFPRPVGAAPDIGAVEFGPDK